MFSQYSTLNTFFHLKLAVGIIEKPISKENYSCPIRIPYTPNHVSITKFNSHFLVFFVRLFATDPSEFGDFDKKNQTIAFQDLETMQLSYIAGQRDLCQNPHS